MADEKPNCKVVLANNIAKSLLEEVHAGLQKIDRKPLLVGFLASADPAAKVYADWTGKTCEEKCVPSLRTLTESPSSLQAIVFAERTTC
jgi:5,10-methylene-tetrahydrofolate dehydrogenase/methenyl tetrahydrofolate cyclohydrolase